MNNVNIKFTQVNNVAALHSDLLTFVEWSDFNI